MDLLTAPTHRLSRSVGRRKGAGRKFRLFAVACCRHDLDAITHPDCRALIDLAERAADDEVKAKELAALRETVHRWARDPGSIVVEPGNAFGSRPGPVDDPDKRWVAQWGAYNAAAADPRPVFGFLHHAPYRPLLADVLGPPKSPRFRAAWRTDTAVTLAQQMYEARDFSAMPILADALQDAGCDDEHILSHCRDPQQVHVRGCWVVDLVLGKE